MFIKDLIERDVFVLTTGDTVIWNAPCNTVNTDVRDTV